MWLQPSLERLQAPAYLKIWVTVLNSGKGMGTSTDTAAKRKVLGQVRDYAEGLRMSGGTAL